MTEPAGETLLLPKCRFILENEKLEIKTVGTGIAGPLCKDKNMIEGTKFLEIYLLLISRLFPDRRGRRAEVLTSLPQWGKGDRPCGG